MIKATFTEKEILRKFDRELGKIRQATYHRLQFLGEKCLAEARTNKTYTDQTGNLTASIGYVIVANGKVTQKAGFHGSDEEGPSQGKSLAESLALKYLTGYALIVVAGMNYAAYVESMGKNVITSAKLLAEKELPRMMKKLNRDYEW